MRVRSWLLSWIVFGGLMPLCASADPPKVEKIDNHVIPLLAEITYKDKQIPKARLMVCAVLAGGHHNRIATHAWNLTGDADAPVHVWLDTIAEVKEIDDKRLTLVFKDGMERTFQHGQEALQVYHANDAREK